MTPVKRGRGGSKIIPYQELLGNYDIRRVAIRMAIIIPYQELLGNYDVKFNQEPRRPIIPYQELLGNYDNQCI